MVVMMMIVGLPPLISPAAEASTRETSRLPETTSRQSELLPPPIYGRACCWSSAATRCRGAGNGSRPFFTPTATC
jgi:hypothetical protein